MYGETGDFINSVPTFSSTAHLMIKQCTCVVSGRVQGIMFRDFARRMARKLRLVGTVENLTDGTVKIVAQGDEVKLNELLLQLKKGHPLAKVTNIVVNFKDATGSFSGFKIIYHGFLDRF